MYKYRITKYNPSFRDGNDVYLRDEWTSYCDIGKVYNGNIFLLEEYMDIEQKYCTALMEILQMNSCKRFTIIDLEIYRDISEEQLSTKEYVLLKALENNMKIPIEIIEDYIKLILREYFWCEFMSENGVVIQFGYDFYMYVICPILDDRVIKKYSDVGIFIEHIYEMV